MLTLFSFVLATGFRGQPTQDLQRILDTNGSVYITVPGTSFESGVNLIAAHNYLPLGKRILQLKKNSRFVFAGKKCQVKDRVVVNYTTGGTSALTGGDLYLQVCTDTPDLANLYKAKCKKQ